MSNEVEHFPCLEVLDVLERDVSYLLDGVLADGDSVVTVSIRGRIDLIPHIFELVHFVIVIPFQILDVEHGLDDVQIMLFIGGEVVLLLLGIDDHLTQFDWSHSPNIALV